MREGLGEVDFRASGEVRDLDLLGLFVVELPDAAEVVVAVRADGSVDVIVVRAAGIVVDDGLVVEVADVDGTVRADANLDGAPPHVLAADEFGFFAAGELVALVRAALLGESLVVDDVDRGFGGEVVAVVFSGP